VAVLLANELAAQGHNLEIMLVRRVGEFLHDLSPSVKIVSADATRTLRALPWMIRHLNRRNSDATVVFGFDLGVALGAAKRLRVLRRRTVFREGSMPLQNIPPRSQWMYRAFVGSHDGVVAQSNAALAQLRRLGVRTKAVVISNPVARQAEAPHKAKRRLDLQSLRVLAIGRLVPEKGYDRLISAWPEIALRYPGATLSVAGHGNDYQHLETLIQNLGLGKAVRLLGYRKDIGTLIDDSDIVVLSSLYEGQPNALIEAIMRSCRVVAAGGESVREMLSDIGLEKCWVGIHDFTQGLLSAINAAVTLPESALSEANRRLNARTDVQQVAKSYMRFCVDR
jgi:glycosyltransferase involved in cell wall biosynthesis